MRVLLDTNIIIRLEDSANGILDESLQNIAKVSSQNNVKLYHHSKSLEDIKNDKDTKRRASILSRLKKYQTLEDSEIKPDQEYYDQLGEKVSSKGCLLYTSPSPRDRG